MLCQYRNYRHGYSITVLDICLLVADIKCWAHVRQSSFPTPTIVTYILTQIAFAWTYYCSGIKLRSRDYLIIPQTIIHSLQLNHTRCRNYIFLFLKYHSRQIHLYPHRYRFIVLHPHRHLFTLGRVGGWIRRTSSSLKATMVDEYDSLK